MRKYVYSFKSAVGTFWIRPEGKKSWSLCVGGEGMIEVLGHYDSPVSAADGVYRQCTGWGEWDRRTHNDAPTSLLLWMRKLVN
jgi:hypothetical protein